MTMLEMSEAEKEERIQCWKCRWTGKKSAMNAKYISPQKKSFMFEEIVEGYVYSCPSCGAILMNSTM